MAAPARKRLAPSLVSLKVFHPEKLDFLPPFRVGAMSILDAVFEIALPETASEEGSELDLPPSMPGPLIATNVAAPFSSKVFASNASLKKGAYTYT